MIEVSRHWRPSLDHDQRRWRAACFARIRGFFDARQILEVDTPILGPATVSDLHVPSLQACSLNGQENPKGYLQTSPESAMKSLLADAPQPIYQLCKAFRDDPEGPLHRREFWLLEWYRPGMDHLALMDEVEEFLVYMLGGGPVVRESYNRAFERLLGIDVDTAPFDELYSICRDAGLASEPITLSRDDCLSFLFAERLQPRLHGRTFIFGYPATQAALAKIGAETPIVAERFELIVEGIELANGYHELRDPEELIRRHARDAVLRREAGLAEVALDQRLLGAMRHGLPACAGVALGVDRLLMLARGERSLDAVMPFSRLT